LINKTFGCARWFWNELVKVFCSNLGKSKEERKEYPNLSQLRKEKPWLAEVSCAAVAYKARNFRVYQNQKFNKARKKQLGNPQRKKRIGRQSFTLDKGRGTGRFNINIKKNRIRLEKVGWVKIVLDREIADDARQVTATVSRNSDGKYYVSITVEETIQPKSKTNKQVGVDLGLKYFCVTSDAEFIKFPPQIRENQARISKLQKIQSRKRGSKKGERKSRRWLKLQRRINRLYQKIVNQRAFFLHTLSTRLVTEYDIIGVEDLNVAGMMRNHCLAGSIGRVAWSEFVRQLEYKCKWYGKTLVKIGRFEPTSKTCSCCGWKNNELTLKDRVFECSECGTTIDRDHNAALNIREKALENDGAIRTQRDGDMKFVSEFC
jgi:putative transposase